MSEMRRYLDAGGDDPKVALLRAGDAESPTSEARLRTLAAVGTAIVGSTTTATGASKLGGAALLKWMGVALLVAGAGVYLGRSHVRAAHAPAAATSPTSVTVQLAPTTAPTVEALLAPAAPAASAPEARPSSHPLVVARPPSSAPAGGSLSDEIATIDEASRAVAAGDANGALRVLDRYQRDYPHGALSPEATTLRIQALLLRGDRAGANALADRFLAQNPDSPHATRIRSLLGRTKP